MSMMTSLAGSGGAGNANPVGIAEDSGGAESPEDMLRLNGRRCDLEVNWRL